MYRLYLVLGISATVAIAIAVFLFIRMKETRSWERETPLLERLQKAVFVAFAPTFLLFSLIGGCGTIEKISSKTILINKNKGEIEKTFEQSSFWWEWNDPDYLDDLPKTREEVITGEEPPREKMILSYKKDEITLAQRAFPYWNKETFPKITFRFGGSPEQALKTFKFFQLRAPSSNKDRWIEYQIYSLYEKNQEYLSKFNDPENKAQQERFKHLVEQFFESKLQNTGIKIADAEFERYKH